MTTRRTDLAARRREHRRNARRRILDAAHALLEQKAWADISLDDITSAAEVARTAFYRHFGDRQQLLMAMLSDVGLELDHIADNWLADADDPVAELRRSLEALTALWVDHGRLIEAISDTARHEPEIGALYQELADRLVGQTARRIRTDVSAGRSQITEPQEVARALTWMNERYLIAVFGRCPVTEPSTAAAALRTVWTNTLYAPRPAEDK